MRISTIALIIAGGLAVNGCAYGSFGRYGGVSVGLGSGGYYNDPWCGGYGYGSPYWGWYDSFYYPGSGFYVYDRYRRPYYWNDRYRRYWTERRETWERRSGRRSLQQATWEGFRENRAARTATVRSQQRVDVDAAPAARVERRSRPQRAATPSSREDRPARRTRPVVRDRED
jgi:hypothetical protein